jgi:hypothetical protein
LLPYFSGGDGGRILGWTSLGIIGGLLSGLLQMPLLKPHFAKAGWWIAASSAGWGLCLLAASTILALVTLMSSSVAGSPIIAAAVLTGLAFFVGGLLFSITLGVVTGGGLLWIAKRPVQIQHDAVNGRMIAHGSEFAATLVILCSVFASGLLGAAMAPGEGTGDKVCWFVVIAMLGGGCAGLVSGAMRTSYLVLTHRRVVDAPIFTLRAMLLVITCYAVVCGIVVGSVPPQERGLLVSWAFVVMVQMMLLLGAWDRLKKEDAAEGVTRFSLRKLGFFLAACSGFVPVLAWLIQFGLSCHESFGGGWQVGEFFLGLGYLLVFVLVPLELLAIAVAFVLVVCVRFHLSLALLLSVVLLSTVYPVVHVQLLFQM